MLILSEDVSRLLCRVTADKTVRLVIRGISIEASWYHIADSWQDADSNSVLKPNNVHQHGELSRLYKVGTLCHKLTTNLNRLRNSVSIWVRIKNNSSNIGIELTPCVITSVKLECSV